MKLEKQTSILGANAYLSVVLTAIAIWLGVLALRPMVNAPAVHAQSERPNFYVEPGVSILRPLDGIGEVQGKVVIDLRTGDVWGFPTSSPAPYPVVVTSHDLPVSEPIHLGRFDFAAMKP